uniref:Uncharacterized protein n=1 Tax=Timema poppense TaxID=170557 RepID=A0A7R9CYF7_TIMPO|nr:unnamed protein product [Timema poppensis]
MSSGSSSISSSPSSSLDSCCSLIISASSRVPQTVMSLSAAMYSSYVQSGAPLCHVSSSHGRVKVRGANEGAVDGSGRGFMQVPTCGSVEGPGWELASTGGGSFGSSALAAVGSTWTAASSSTGKTKWACRKQLNSEKCRLRDAMPPRNLRLCNLLLIHFLDDLVLLHEHQEGPPFTHFWFWHVYGNFYKYIFKYESPLLCVLCTAFCFSHVIKMEESPLNRTLQLVQLGGLDYGSGMAYSFFYGYLQFILPNKGDSNKGTYFKAQFPRRIYDQRLDWFP